MELFNPNVCITLFSQQTIVFRIFALKLMVSVISKTDPNYTKWHQIDACWSYAKSPTMN